MSLFRSSPTSLDLNGPTLYFSSQPVGVATSTSSSASLTGIATVSFMTVGDVANPATGTGTIDYQWYQGQQIQLKQDYNQGIQMLVGSSMPKKQKGEK